MYPNIGYHTRSCEDDKKLVGGSFGGSIDMETVERLVKAHFTVTVRPSGTPHFVDKQGRHVRVYLSIDAKETSMGKAALKAWREQREREEKARQQREEQETEEREQAMSGLTHEEIMRRLRG